MLLRLVSKLTVKLYPQTFYPFSLHMSFRCRQQINVRYARISGYVLRFLLSSKILYKLTNTYLVSLLLYFTIIYWLGEPVPVAARSKALVYGRSPAAIVGSNPTRSMDVCLLCVLCVVRQRSLRRSDHSFRGVLPTVTRRCV